ncbi:MAG: NAD(P)-dependent alcohol dehydrogenase [Nocardioidaceae bacterium]
MTADPIIEVPDTMRASVMTGLGSLQVEIRAVPVPTEHQVLVEVAAVGVCGSDVHYYRHGRIAHCVVTGPLILGHELSGRIVGTGAKVDDTRIGQRVAVEPQRPCRRCTQCLTGHYNLCPRMEFYATPPVDGAFCRYVVIEADMAHPIPDSLSDEAAALLEPLSVAIAAVRKARTTAGASVLIAGAGPIGILCAQTARAFGATRVVVSDPVVSRRECALRYGATEVIDPAAVDVATLEPQVEAFIDASGASAAVVTGIRAVRPTGRVVLVGMGEDEMTLPVSYLQYSEIVLTGVERYANTWATAIALAAGGLVDLDSLVTGRYDLDHVAEAFEALPGLKSIVVPR